MNAGQNNLVEVRGAYKSYSKTEVILQGLDMTVEPGTIYGLLGASGCGKTTLLSCITGQKKLDAGTVTVELQSRKQLGYMPQDVAMIDLFTVSEMLKYFGKIYGMSRANIIERGRELLNLVEMPPERFWKRIIFSLSGGQQRRVSLCVALLHDPTLIIMDEPTVGLDPVIREKLWDYFIQITEEGGKTLIITTHYIEETGRANKVGLMRMGVLLAEASPSRLLKKHNLSALEDVFLLLSQGQVQDSGENIKTYPKKKKSVRPLQESVRWNCKRMRAQVYKNSCWIKRNIPIMLFMLVLPAIMQIMFCVAFQDTFTGVNIAFVSEEVLPDSCLNPANPDLVIHPCDNRSMISCRFVEKVRSSSYDMLEYDRFDLAYEEFKKGEARALMHFSKDYSVSLRRRLSDGQRTPDHYIDDSNVDVYVDSAEVTMALIIKKQMRDGFKEMIRSYVQECGKNPRADEQVLKFEKPVYGERFPKFSHTAMAGFVIPAVFYFTTFLSSSSLGSEKIAGFLERCLVTGVKFVEIVAAHAIVQVVMLILQTAMIFAIAYGIFKLPLIGDWALAALFMVIVQLQGMVYGFILGTAFDEEKNIVYVALGTVLCLFLSCGMFWPLEGAHWTVYYTMRWSPIIMAVQSYHSIALRGWDLSHKYIVYSLISNTGFILFLVCIFFIVCKVKM